MLLTQQSVSLGATVSFTGHDSQFYWTQQSVLLDASQFYWTQQSVLLVVTETKRLEAATPSSRHEGFGMCLTVSLDATETRQQHPVPDMLCHVS